MRPGLFVTVALAIVGCGNDGTISGSDVPTFSAYLEKGEQVSCDHLVRCGAISASERASCLAQLAKYPSPIDNAAEVAAGRYAYDSAAGAACLSAYATASCNDFYRLFAAPCSNVLRGMQPAAATCFSSSECQGGRCDSPQFGCGGQCASVAEVGQSCQGSPCNGWTSFCDSATFTCKALGEVGAGCTDDRQCRPGLQCLIDPNTGKGSCGSGRPAGGSCRSLFDCNVGLFCDLDSHTCKATVGTGSPCWSTDECDGLACIGLDNSGKKGVCGPWSDLGKPCDSKANYRGSGCPASLRCDPGSSTCVAFKAGDECANSGYNCGLELQCDIDKKMCLARVPLGGACTAGQSICDWGSCDANTSTCKLTCR